MPPNQSLGYSTSREPPPDSGLRTPEAFPFVHPKASPLLCLPLRPSPKAKDSGWRLCSSRSDGLHLFPHTRGGEEISKSKTRVLRAGSLSTALGLGSPLGRNLEGRRRTAGVNGREILRGSKGPGAHGGRNYTSLEASLALHLAGFHEGSRSFPEWGWSVLRAPSAHAPAQCPPLDLELMSHPAAAAAVLSFVSQAVGARAGVPGVPGVPPSPSFPQDSPLLALGPNGARLPGGRSAQRARLPLLLRTT